jgi:cytochrome c2
MRISVVILTLAIAPALASCDAQSKNMGADAKKGAQLIAQTGCGACHTIPRIAKAAGRIGPPLDHMHERTYIAGILRNTPENMITWLQHPQRVVPGNAMPEMGLSDPDARAITAYLDTLN